VAGTAGNLRAQNSKALNEEAVKREGLVKIEDLEKKRDLGEKGGPERTEGNLIARVENFDLGSLPLKFPFRKFRI